MFVIFEMIDGVMWHLKEVKTEGGAKRSVLALVKKLEARRAKGYKSRIEYYGYMSALDWAHLKRPMKTVRSLMTGELIEIPADTPLSCDPSSETYWSM